MCASTRVSSHENVRFVVLNDLPVRQLVESILVLVVLNDLPVRQLVESILVLVFFLDFQRLLLHGDAATVRKDRLFTVDRLRAFFRLYFIC